MKSICLITAFLCLVLLAPRSLAQDAAAAGRDLPSDPRCAQGGERGPCKALIESWHYDPGSNSCKQFFWGGCGRPRPFSSEKECLGACAGREKQER